MSSSDHKKNQRELLKHIKAETLYYEQLTKDFPKIKGYPNYEKAVTVRLACLLYGFDKFISSEELENDHTLEQGCLTASLMASLDVPVYWLKRDLLTAFLRTDLPELIYDMKQVIQHGLLMLPNQQELISPDGEVVEWVQFSHFLAEDFENTMEVSPNVQLDSQEKVDKLRWATMLSSGIIYSNLIGLERGEDNKPISGDLRINDMLKMIEPNTDIDTETQFIEKVDNLILQTLLFLQTRPDDVVAQMPESKGLSQSQAKQKLAPIWIGYRYQINKERLSSGESPQQRQRQSAGWWRRGHWRRVPIGKRGENLRDWRWIEPTWCEPS
ncbi:MAG TPA: hypothetical protein V6D21_13790 [Candidatus Obscuribacterales bacterium]